MKIMVTGGAGFIGSALIRHLLSLKNIKILNIDNLSYAGNLNSIPKELLGKDYTFKKIDICNFDEIDNQIRSFKPDKVMHLAAESHVDRSIEDPEVFLRTNIFGTYNLLESSLAYWTKLNGSKKSSFVFHHISTDEVYGDLKFKNDFFTENSNYNPSSPYSASKASSDHLVRAWNKTYQLPTIISNCSNNYGPFHFPEKFIPNVIISALTGQTISIYGDGQQIRDWLFVEDHVKALMKIINSNRSGETFNIGGKNEVKNIDVAYKICDLLEDLCPQKPTNINYYRDLISFVEDRPGHDQRYAIDASKISNLLDWRPLETFDSGIKKTVLWYLNNRAWWETILENKSHLQRKGLKNDSI